MVKVEVCIKNGGSRSTQELWVSRVPHRGENLVIEGVGLATVSEVVQYDYETPRGVDAVVARASVIVAAGG